MMNMMPLIIDPPVENVELFMGRHTPSTRHLTLAGVSMEVPVSLLENLDKHVAALVEICNAPKVSEKSLVKASYNCTGLKDTILAKVKDYNRGKLLFQNPFRAGQGTDDDDEEIFMKKELD